MDLVEYHFSQITGNLYWDQETDTYEMFSGKGSPKHLNYLTFKELFKNMEGLKDPIILETGIASAGTMSTYLFNEYIKKYGGRFWSVDNDPELVAAHQGNMCPGTKLVHNDSVAFFKEWTYTSGIPRADVIYLDSYDLDFYNPEPSAKHGLAEYMSLKPAIKKDTLLLIDDTPMNPYWLDTRDHTYYDMLDYYGMFGIAFTKKTGGTAYCFDGSLSVLIALTQTIELNKLYNIRYNRMLIGDENKLMGVTYDTHQSLINQQSSMQDIMLTIDTFCAINEVKPDCIKVDVEGFEIITVDVVAQPSAPGAYPTPVYEHLMNAQGGYKAFQVAQEVQGDTQAQRYIAESLKNFISSLNKA